jgi:hypothetical protein
VKRPVYLIVGAALLLAGCASPPEPVPTTEPTTEPIAASDTCKQWSNLVLTPLANATVAFIDGRMEAQEVEGIGRTTAEALDLITVEPGGDLAFAIQTARDIPDDELVNPGDVDSEGWAFAAGGVEKACSDSGAEVWVNMWTGG